MLLLQSTPVALTAVHVDIALTVHNKTGQKRVVRRVFIEINVTLFLSF